MDAYRQLVAVAVPARQAAALVGVSRTSVYRKPAPPVDREPVVPPNKLSVAVRAEILAVLNSTEFVDVAPLQVYVKLLDAGIYLGSVSTFYRVLEGNQRVKERRRLAKHPPRAVPELVATKPGQVLGYYKARRPGQREVLRLLFDGGYPLEVYCWCACARIRIRGVGGGDDEGNLRHPRDPLWYSTRTAGPR